MKGILNKDFTLTLLTEQEVKLGQANFLSVEDLIHLGKGETVEILKVIETDEFLGGNGYVVFNPDTFESLTIASTFVDLIEE